MRLLLKITASLFIFILLIIVIVYRFGTSYYPIYSFNENQYKRVYASANVTANAIRFKNTEVKDEIRELMKKDKIYDLKDIAALSVWIVKNRLYYDTTTLIGFRTTDLKKAYRQHDVDWLFITGHANCIGYSYLFAATFNEIKRYFPDIGESSVRIIYQSPARMLFGYWRATHTWNEIIYQKNGKERKLYVDALAAEYYLRWDITMFIDEKYNR